MKKRRNIIIIISIVVCIAIGFILFNEHSELDHKLEKSQSRVEACLVKQHEFIKDSFLTILSGGAIYIVFYAIPHEYQMVNQKDKSKN